MIFKSRKTLLAALGLVALFLIFGAFSCSSDSTVERTPEAALKALRQGNERFAAGEAVHPRTDAARLAQAGTESQGDHAYATVLACSDSRVPVERLFDAGVMDIFVVRVAGNVVQGDEAGSIEYGLAHVKTPVLVVLGHTQCGAVTAVTAALEGHGHALERNIPGLVKPVIPAVQQAMQEHPDVHGADLVPFGIENNVWQNIRNLFMLSPATRELVKSGKVAVVGAVYDVSTGRVEWLPAARVDEILAAVEADPARATEAMASGAGAAQPDHDGAPAAAAENEQAVSEAEHAADAAEDAAGSSGSGAEVETVEAVEVPAANATDAGEETVTQEAAVPCPGQMARDTMAIHAQAALEQAEMAGKAAQVAAEAAAKAAEAAGEAARAAEAAALAAQAAQAQQ
jgi:carbonic anhydrase